MAHQRHAHGGIAHSAGAIHPARRPLRAGGGAEMFRGILPSLGVAHDTTVLDINEIVNPHAEVAVVIFRVQRHSRSRRLKLREHIHDHAAITDHEAVKPFLAGQHIPRGAARLTGLPGQVQLNHHLVRRPPARIRDVLDAGGAELEQVLGRAVPPVRPAGISEGQLPVEIHHAPVPVHLHTAMPAHDGLVMDEGVLMGTRDRHAGGRADVVKLRFEPEMRGVIGWKEERRHRPPLPGDFEPPRLVFKRPLVLHHKSAGTRLPRGRASCSHGQGPRQKTTPATSWKGVAHAPMIHPSSTPTATKIERPSMGK